MSPGVAVVNIFNYDESVWIGDLDLQLGPWILSLVFLLNLDMASNELKDSMASWLELKDSMASNELKDTRGPKVTVRDLF